MLPLCIQASKSHFEQTREVQNKIFEVKDVREVSSDSEQLFIILEKENIAPKLIQLIISQHTYIPVIKNAVNELAALYAQAKMETADKSSKIYQKIMNQINNIEKLALMFKSFLKGGNAVSQAALVGLTLKKAYLSFTMQPYLLGEKELQDDQEFEEIKDQLFKCAKKIESNLRVTSALLAEKREHSPITTMVIKKQARLHEGLRCGKASAVQQESLTSLKTSINDVYALTKPGSNKVVAFYKETADRSGILEQLMWESAVVMGLEEYFVPTASTVLYTKGPAGDGNRQGKSWNKSGSELVEWTMSETGHVGSLQPAQEGQTLDKIRKSYSHPGEIILTSQLMIAILVGSLMGFFDAHDKNILIDSEGNIKFFDNTSTMPHSNGCILWGGQHLKSSFKLNLLSLPECHQAFTANQRKLIAIEVESYQAKYYALKEFYKNRATQSKIRKLPQGWFQPEKSLAAMQERIARLEAAVKEPNITTLCELSLASQPNLRFNILMSHLYSIIGKLPFKSLDVNYYLPYIDSAADIEGCVLKCCQYGYDPLIIKGWCDDPKLSFKDLMKLLQTYPNRISKEHAQHLGLRLIEQLKSAAHPDFKDWYPETS